MLVVILTALLAFALVVASPTHTSSGMALVAVISVTSALLIAYPGMWLFSRLPNTIVVMPDRIIFGREVIHLAKLQSAIVGTTRMGGTEHRVFIFRTKDGYEYLFGLGHKIKSEQLAAFLQQAGVHEPRA